MHLFQRPSIHFQRVKQTIHGPVNIPWPASPNSPLEFCSWSTLVSSACCCSRRVISMTIVLGFSGGSVAPILWGHFQAIKSFICVDLKESCEVPSGWNPLQWVTTVSMGVTVTGSHQYCAHILQSNINDTSARLLKVLYIVPERQRQLGVGLGMLELEGKKRDAWWANCHSVRGAKAKGQKIIHFGSSTGWVWHTWDAVSTSDPHLTYLKCADTQTTQQPNGSDG